MFLPFVLPTWFLLAFPSTVSGDGHRPLWVLCVLMAKGPAWVFGAWAAEPTGCFHPGTAWEEGEAGLCGNTPQDHNLDPGSVLHVTSDPGDPVPRSRASTPAAPTLSISQWTMWPSLGILSTCPAPERGAVLCAQHRWPTSVCRCWASRSSWMPAWGPADGAHRGGHQGEPALWPHGVHAGLRGGGGGGRGYARGSASQRHPRLVQAGRWGPLRRWAHVHSDGHLATPGRRGRPLRGKHRPTPVRRCWPLREWTHIHPDRHTSTQTDTCPRKWTHGHSRQERLTFKGTTQVHSR